MTLQNLFRTGALAAGLAVVGLASNATAQECENAPTGTRLNIVIDDVRSAKGQISASIYPDIPAVFLQKNGAIKVWYEPPKTPSTEMCIWIPGPGTYAVVAYQDINRNRQWDHNFLKGVEPIGFSNNPFLSFAKPSFDSVKFHVKAAETTIHIRLHHI